jgi:hypothetical protein
MGRSPKIGLDYFPHDTSTNESIELMEFECGLIGYAIMVKLWERIYANGYFLNFNEDSKMLFCKKNNIDKDLIEKTLIVFFKRKIFNENLYKKYQILTNQLIQENFIQICKEAKRKKPEFIKEYILINSEYNQFIMEISLKTTEEITITTEEKIITTEENENNSEHFQSNAEEIKNTSTSLVILEPEKQESNPQEDLTGFTPDKSLFTPEESTQSKEKESKEKKNKENKKIYSEEKNVFLFEEEYQKLILKLGSKELVEFWIEEVSLWKLKGNKTKSDYATIYTWFRKKNQTNLEKNHSLNVKNGKGQDKIMTTEEWQEYAKNHKIENEITLTDQEIEELENKES